jgi:TrmH family RNA methyltransferase
MKRRNTQSVRKIMSVQNNEIKQVAKLGMAKERSKQGRFIAEGSRVCMTLVQAGYKPECIYVTEQAYADQFTHVVPGRDIALVHSHVMEKISQATTPSGILGVFRIPDQPRLDTLSSGLVLAKISDPGNLGTLLRTAAAMNKRSVVLISGADPYSPKVVQASAGCIAYLDIFRLEWDMLLKAKSARKLQLVALVVNGGQSPAGIHLSDALLVVGSEAHGIPDSWLITCDRRMTIPMPGNIESLNAAVAGSIALYIAYQQTVRQSS